MEKLSDFVRKEELEEFWVYRKGREEGRQEGQAEGREEAVLSLLSSLLREKYGELPASAQARL